MIKANSLRMVLTNEDGDDFGVCVLMFPTWDGNEQELYEKVLSTWKDGYYNLIAEVEKNDFNRFYYDENHSDFQDIVEDRMEGNYSNVWNQFYSMEFDTIDKALEYYFQ